MSINEQYNPPLNIQDLLDAIPFREPVLPDPVFPDTKLGAPGFTAIDAWISKDTANNDALERRWNATSEAIRRAVLTNTAVRQAVGTVVAEPLTEKLPATVVRLVSSNDKPTERIADNTQLQTFLRLPAVEDTALKPSLRMAPQLYDRPAATKAFERDRLYGDDDPLQLMQHINAQVQEYPGISQQERSMVAKRYRFARDVKLIALAAELLDSKVEPNMEGSTHTFDLPSGAKIVVADKSLATTPELLQPKSWVGRKQIKDRVYRVQIGDTPFILKERKTTRHTDTPRHGHFESLSSRQEFETAQHFSSLGIISANGIELRWEKPVGYVEFPDGYQFCLFEFEPLLTNKSKFANAAAITEKILTNQADYIDEFELIKERTQQLYTSDYTYLSPYPLAPTKHPRRWFASKKRAEKSSNTMVVTDQELTFKEYAELKADRLVHDVSSLVNEAITSQGYMEADGHEEAAQVSDKPGVLIEAVAFDVEYCFYKPEAAKAYAESQAAFKASGKHIVFKPHVRNHERERLLEAANLALAEQAGWHIPVEV